MDKDDIKRLVVRSQAAQIVGSKFNRGGPIGEGLGTSNLALFSVHAYDAPRGHDRRQPLGYGPRPTAPVQEVHPGSEVLQQELSVRIGGAVRQETDRALIVSNRIPIHKRPCWILLLQELAGDARAGVFLFRIAGGDDGRHGGGPISGNGLGASVPSQHQRAALVRLVAIGRVQHAGVG